MNSKTIQKLEFQKVMKKLSGLCGSAWGKQAVLEMPVYDEPDDVRDALAETTEAKRFIDVEGLLWDFGALPDMREGLLKIEGGRVLEPAELAGFMKSLDFAASVKGAKVDADAYPRIQELRARLFAGTRIARRIKESIDAGSDTVRDSASPALAKTRRKIRNLEQQIPGRLRKMLASAEMENVVQDRVVTIRNGRFVIPLKSEQAARGSWVLQDRSATGSTSFVEPLELVEENNSLIRERLSEKAEVLRILRELSRMLSARYAEIEDSMLALGELDCLLARGRLSIEMNAVEPKINESGVIEIRSGRHPLLTGDVMPVNLALGGEIRALLLTGPNAGGKTVTMKMAGLFLLMAQAGLHVPAEEDTTLPVMEGVYVVIGDEQSIENNLSTFSSHLAEISSILEYAGQDSVVFIDEICSGTDPEEGAALACGVIRELMERGATCMATSHHSGLKNFAADTPGAENARMIFDEKQGRPAFQVEIGMPGQSYALEIAAQAGLSDRIIQSAREYISEQTKMTEKLLADLQEMKSFVSIERMAIDREKKKLEHERESQQQAASDAQREREEILNKTFAEAERIIEETKDRCMLIMNAARKAASLPQTAMVKGAVKKTRKKVAKKKKKALGRPGAVDPAKLKPDMELLMKDSSETVRFREGPDRKGRVKVMLGDFMLSTTLDNLALPGADARPKPYIPRAKTKPRADYEKYLDKARESAKSRIDLHGMRVLEAKEVLDREIDNLNVAGAGEVTIVHGIGSGALMKFVHEYLDKSPFITRYESCSIGRGGIGATKAYFA